MPLMPIELSIVIPIYQAQDTIKTLADQLLSTLGSLSYEIILVNDGSSDDTEAICKEIAENNSSVLFICLSKNFGEFNAVMCGLNYARGKYIVIMDDDLQNPPAEALKLYHKAKEINYDVVYAQYRLKSHQLYRNIGSGVANAVAGMVYTKPAGIYLASFKAISNDLCKKIIQYKGSNPYIDGLILKNTAYIGSMNSIHLKNESGRSRYTLKKLIFHFINILSAHTTKAARNTTLISFLLYAGSIIFLFMRDNLVSLLLFIIATLCMTFSLILWRRHGESNGTAGHQYVIKYIRQLKNQAV